MIAHARLEELLDQFLDGGMNLKDKAELEGMLNESAEARKTYWEFARLHGELREAETQRWLEVADVDYLYNEEDYSEEASSSGWRVHLFQFAAVLLVLLGGILLASRLYDETIGGQEFEPSPGAAFYGVLSATHGAVWDASAGGNWNPGDVIGQKDFMLKEGVAECTLFSGVVIVVEGPTKISFVNTETVYVHFGKISVRGPVRAIGFTVETPKAQIVDNGTAFGVAVDAEGKTEAHALDGKIILKNLHGKSQTLKTGERSVVGLGGEALLVTAADPAAFPKPSRTVDLSTAGNIGKSLAPTGIWQALPLDGIDLNRSTTISFRARMNVEKSLNQPLVPTISLGAQVSSTLPELDTAVTAMRTLDANGDSWELLTVELDLPADCHAVFVRLAGRSNEKNQAIEHDALLLKEVMITVTQPPVSSIR